MNLPENALPRSRYSHELPSVKGVGEVWETRTFTVYPKQSACQIPVLESTASGKPYRRFTGVDSAGDDVIFRRVWRRDPDSGILL